MWLFQWFSNSVYYIVLLLLSAWSRDARGNAKQFLLYKKTQKERRLALHENGTHFAQKSNTPRSSSSSSTSRHHYSFSDLFFFNVGGTEQHRVVSNILGSFTTKLQECRKTSTHRKKIFLLPLSHSDESGDNLPSLFKKGKAGLNPARSKWSFPKLFFNSSVQVYGRNIDRLIISDGSNQLFFLALLRRK